MKKPNDKFRKLFKDFKEELKNKGITVEMRILLDPEIISQFHDRWIISKNKCYNVISTDTVFRGQYSEIKETKNKPPFEKWWKEGKDIIKNWNDIRNNLE